ncbi:TPA: hypothetical protein TVB68_001533 [Streptococcus equi subsp. ruminatorum]|nr:hypothetical protein [Streptococcus equi subsp. ruminatorum]
MRHIHDYTKTKILPRIEQQLLQEEVVAFLEDELQYLPTKTRDEEHIMGYYHLGLAKADQWLYPSVQLTIYHTNWEISHYGISWEQTPVYVNTLEALTSVLFLFAELPFSIYCDKVTFDWQEALRDLGDAKSMLPDETLRTYLQAKEWAFYQRIGNYRYRISFPEQAFRTLEDTLDSLKKLNHCFEAIHDYFERGEMD